MDGVLVHTNIYIDIIGTAKSVINYHPRGMPKVKLRVRNSPHTV